MALRLLPNDRPRPSQIPAWHLERKAVVYVRQSSDAQVQLNQGSTAHQLAQVQLAISLGWDEKMVTVIDDDLGASGASTIHRVGYQRMLRMIQAGEVGIVFVADLSRLGRNLVDQVVFLDECRNRGTLLNVGGRVHDPRDRNDRLLATMGMGLAENENEGRSETLQSGRLARARQGYAVSNPPAGYVKYKGEWLKDPDEQVQLAIQAAFDAILEGRTLRKAAGTLNSKRILLPRRDGPLTRWVPADVGKLSFLARNRAYVGDYIFRKRRVDRALGRSRNGRLKDRPATEDETVIVENHHEPYISREVWGELQALLDANASSDAHTNLGPGHAFLQGLIYCSLHGAAMSPKDKRGHTTENHTYTCPGDAMVGGKACMAIPSRQLERAVVARMGAFIEPPSIEQLKESIRLEVQAALTEEQRRNLEIHRLRREVEDLRRRYHAVDLNNPKVKADSEAALERAITALEVAESGAGEQRGLPQFSERDFADLIELGGQFEDLWEAETTEAVHRKQLTRAMVRRIWVVGRDEEELRIRIEWADVWPNESLSVKLHPYVIRLIGELAAEGRSDEEVAEVLEGHDFRTLRGHRWTGKGVRELRNRQVRRVKKAG